MKVRFILVFALLAAISLDLYAQMDARQLPYFLDAQKSKMIPGILMRGEKFVPAPDGDYDYNAKREDVLYSNEGIKLIKVTKESNAKSETHIAIDPNNPNVIIGTSNDSRYNHSGVGYRMGAYYTNDGGATWGNSTTPANMDLWIKKPTAAGSSMTIFDPSIDFDSKGNAYYLYGFTQIINSLDDGNNGVFISKSPNGGKTWETPLPVILAEGSSVPFHDRYWIAVDNQPNSPYKDNIYVSWQRFKQDDGIVFSWLNSSNFGISDFSTPLKLGSNSTQSPMPAVGPDGEVYVAWQQRQGMKTDAAVRKSVNGGKSFSEAKTAQSIFTVGTVMSSSGRFVLADKQNMRASSYPAIAVDCSNSPKRGYVYLVQTGKLAADAPAGVFLSVSKDGTSWMPNQKIDENETLGRDVFFPAIDIDPVSGMIAVLYYSSKDADNNKGVDAYIAISTDGGQTFKNTRLTSESFYIDNQYKVSYQGTGNYYWGDYTGVTIHNKKIYPLFWWPSNAQGYFNYLDCYTAILSPMPKAPTDLSSYTGATDVKITWVDPIYDMLGNELDNFKINIYRDGNKIAEAAKGTREFTDNSPTLGQNHHYELETEINSELKSEKVSIYVTPGGNPTAKAPTDITFDFNSNGLVLNWTNPSQHIDNTDLWDFAAVSIYIDDIKLTDVPMTPAQAGKRHSEFIQLEANKYYKIQLSPITNRDGMIKEGTFSEEIIAYAGMPGNNFSENFDGEVVKPLKHLISTPIRNYGTKTLLNALGRRKQLI